MSDLAGAAPTAATLPAPPDGRPSWWRVVGQALLAGLLLLAGQVALLTVLMVLPGDAVDGVAGRFLALGGDVWPPFGHAPLANGAALCLVTIAGAAALRLAVSSRTGEPPAFAWMLLAAVAWVSATGAGDGLFAAVVTVVVIRQCGFLPDGAPRPSPVPGGAVLAATGVLAVACLATILARTWTDPLVIPPGSGWDPVLAPVRARDLAPADRVRGAGVLRVWVKNASPRSTTVTSVDASPLQVLGVRRHRGGTWQDGDPVYLPADPIRLAPGQDRMLTVLVAGRCSAGRALDVRLGTTTGTSTVRLHGVRRGARC